MSNLYESKNYDLTFRGILSSNIFYFMLEYEYQFNF